MQLILDTCPLAGCVACSQIVLPADGQWQMFMRGACCSVYALVGTLCVLAHPSVTEVWQSIQYIPSSEFWLFTAWGGELIDWVEFDIP